MSGTYAAQTSVSSEKSRNEIERTLTRYGATQFAYGWQGSQALIGFTINDRQVRFLLPLPDRDDRSFTRTPTGRTRSASEASKAYEQGVRQKWRALALIVKAKLEAVESGIVTFEEEFAMHMLLPGGQPVSGLVLDAIDESYRVGSAAPMLQLTAS